MDVTPDRPAYPAQPTTDKPVGDRLTAILIVAVLQLIALAWLVWDLAIEG